MFWKLAIVVLLPLLLYGRSGLMRHPVFRFLIPATPPSRRQTAASSPARRDSRIFFVLLTLGSVAVGSWIIARAFIDRH